MLHVVALSGRGLGLPSLWRAHEDDHRRARIEQLALGRQVDAAARVVHPCTVRPRELERLRRGLSCGRRQSARSRRGLEAAQPRADRLEARPLDELVDGQQRGGGSEGAEGRLVAGREAADLGAGGARGLCVRGGFEKGAAGGRRSIAAGLWATVGGERLEVRGHVGVVAVAAPRRADTTAAQLGKARAVAARRAGEQARLLRHVAPLHEGQVGAAAREDARVVVREGHGSRRAYVAAVPLGRRVGRAGWPPVETHAALRVGGREDLAVVRAGDRVQAATTADPRRLGAPAQAARLPCPCHVAHGDRVPDATHAGRGDGRGGGGRRADARHQRARRASTVAAACGEGGTRGAGVQPLALTSDLPGICICICVCLCIYV